MWGVAVDPVFGKLAGELNTSLYDGVFAPRHFPYYIVSGMPDFIRIASLINVVMCHGCNGSDKSDKVPCSYIMNWNGKAGPSY